MITIRHKFLFYLFLMALGIILILVLIHFGIKLYEDGTTNYKSKINDILNDNILAPKRDLEYHTTDSDNILDTPLKYIYINSSHNSYISGVQDFSWIYPDHITEVLSKGARCIELDIHYVNGKFYVGHGQNKTFVTNQYRLEDVLVRILDFSYSISDPIFLTLEVDIDINDIIIRQSLAKLIKNILQIKFLDDTYKIKNKSAPILSEKPLRFFLNKIIILDNHNIGLEDITDNCYFHNINSSNIIIKPSSSKWSAGLFRIYPNNSIMSLYSYNFDPQPYWDVGYNLVALNYEENDSYLFKNFQKFQSCNFVKFDDSVKTIVDK